MPVGPSSRHSNRTPVTTCYLSGRRRDWSIGLSLRTWMPCIPKLAPGGLQSCMAARIGLYVWAVRRGWGDGTYRTCLNVSTQDLGWRQMPSTRMEMWYSRKNRWKTSRWDGMVMSSRLMRSMSYYLFACRLFEARLSLVIVMHRNKLAVNDLATQGTMTLVKFSINRTPEGEHFNALCLNKMASIFTDDIFKCNFLDENFRIWIPVAVKFVINDAELTTRQAAMHQPTMTQTVT